MFFRFHRGLSLSPTTAFSLYPKPDLFWNLPERVSYSICLPRMYKGVFLVYVQHVLLESLPHTKWNLTTGLVLTSRVTGVIWLQFQWHIHGTFEDNLDVSFFYEMSLILTIISHMAKFPDPSSSCPFPLIFFSLNSDSLNYDPHDMLQNYKCGVTSAVPWNLSIQDWNFNFFKGFMDLYRRT